MDCVAFDAWLDAGMPAPDAAPAAHANGCARCAARWREALELEAWLAAPAALTPPPAGFVDAVMLRVHETPRPAAALARVAPPAVPWWVRAAAEPAAVGAFAIAALIAWRPGALGSVALAVGAWSGAAGTGIVRLLERAPAPGAGVVLAVPWAASITALSLSALAAWGAWALLAWAPSLFRRALVVGRG
jgi:hypothetical protein